MLMLLHKVIFPLLLSKKCAELLDSRNCLENTLQFKDKFTGINSDYDYT